MFPARDNLFAIIARASTGKPYEMSWRDDARAAMDAYRDEVLAEQAANRTSEEPRKGNHLFRITHTDGATTLVWADRADIGMNTAGGSLLALWTDPVEDAEPGSKERVYTAVPGTWTAVIRLDALPAFETMEG